jgi:hypothetical protein
MPTLESEFARLRSEYHITLRVLALLVEQLTEHEEVIVISDAALLQSPDLFAWRNEEDSCIALQVKRGSTVEPAANPFTVISEETEREEEDVQNEVPMPAPVLTPEEIDEELRIKAKTWLKTKWHPKAVTEDFRAALEAWLNK